MLTNLHELVKEAIDKENEILLTIGQNTYYIENDKYSISIEYSLEKNDYLSFGGKYDFDITSILIIDNKDYSEYIIEPNEKIISSLFNDETEIEDFGNEIDLLIKENY